MKCPYCQTENREDRDECYYCEKDISMLRLLTARSRLHFNNALEHADRQRHEEAAAELRDALDLDASFARARVVLGALYAKMGRDELARETWRDAIETDPHVAKAFQYLGEADSVIQERPTRKLLRWTTGASVVLGLLALILAGAALSTPSEWRGLASASEAIEKNDFATASKKLEGLAKSEGGTASEAARAMDKLLRGSFEARVANAREAIARQDHQAVRQALEGLAGQALPDWVREDASAMRSEWAASFGRTLDGARENLDALASGRAAARLAQRLAALAESAPSKELEARALSLAASAKAAADKLPFDESAEGYRQREAALLAHAEAVRSGDWDRAETLLIQALESFDEGKRQAAAAMAESLWIARVAETGAALEDAPEPARLRERFPDLAFDPARLLRPPAPEAEPETAPEALSEEASAPPAENAAASSEEAPAETGTTAPAETEEAAPAEGEEPSEE